MPVFGKMRLMDNFHYGFPSQMIHQGSFGVRWDRQQDYRNQAIMYQPPMQIRGLNPNLYQGVNVPHTIQPFGQNFQSGIMQTHMNYNQNHLQKDVQFLFQNPLQPKEEMMTNPYQHMSGYPLMNPYPKQSFIPKPPGGFQSFMNSFKSQDGTLDLNKMINTAGQMMNAVSQVTSLVKSFGGIFKT